MENMVTLPGYNPSDRMFDERVKDESREVINAYLNSCMLEGTKIPRLDVKVGRIPIQVFPNDAISKISEWVDVQNYEEKQMEIVDGILEFIEEQLITHHLILNDYDDLSQADWDILTETLVEFNSNLKDKLSAEGMEDDVN